MRRALIPIALGAVATLLLSSCQQVPDGLREAEALACPSGSECYDPPIPRGPGGTVEALSGEFFFELVSVQAFEGEVEILLDNSQAEAEHNFTIDEASGDNRSVPPGDQNVPPGETATGTLLLYAGEYTFYCSVPGHRASGMEGTLTVAAPGEEVSPAAGATGTEGPAPGQEGAATPGEPGPEGSPAPGEQPTGG